MELFWTVVAYVVLVGLGALPLALLVWLWHAARPQSRGS